MSGKVNDKHKKRTKIPKKDEGLPWFVIIIAAVFKWFPVAAVMLGHKIYRIVKNKRLDEYERCLRAIGDSIAMPINDLARKLGEPKQRVIKILSEMIEKNYLGKEAFVDYSQDMLYILRPAGEARAKKSNHIEFDFSELSKLAELGDLSKIISGVAGIAGDVARTLKNSFAGATTDAGYGHRYAPSGSKPEQEVKAEPEPEPAPEPAPEAAAPEAETEAEAAASEKTASESTLERLKLLNDQILDEDVSLKIDRIAQLTGDIYDFADANPERAGEVRKFMNYYLPTTMKLLTSYGMLERQSYQGENIIAARRDIEKILDTLVHAFEKQLDQLFATDAVDISSDIQVLETMMAKDGLSEDKKGYSLKL